MPSTLVTPLLISKPFGFGASNPTYINIPIPVPSQIGTTVNAASFTDGFPPSTMTPEASGGLPFFGQDMNGILYMVSAYCANFAAGALSQYNSTLSGNISGYPVGAVLANAFGTGLWINQVSGNTTNPDTGGAGWFGAGLTGSYVVPVSGSNITLTPAQYSVPIIAFSGTLTANINVIFPATVGQQWLVVNETAGAFTLTCKTASGTGVVIPQTNFSSPTSLYCDSVNIQNTGISTAGLAPINSPTFTGTPAGPTATPATLNNTQLANTAFVQAAIAAALATYAPKASPIFTGTPTAPTAAPGTNTTQLATTAFVAAGSASNPICKGGTISLANGSNTYNFPTPFVTACISVVIMAGPGSTDATIFLQSAPTRTGFTVAVGVTGSYQYIAIGY